MTKPAIHAIPEERVAAILARAAELDRERKETITVDAIRTAALDAGISPSAVDAALAEYAAGEVIVPEAEPEPRARRFGRLRDLLGRGVAMLKTPLKLAAVFFLVGLAGAAGEEMVVIAWLAWLVVSGVLMVKHRRVRRATPYVLALVYMTFGLMLGSAAGEVDEDAIIALIPAGMALLAIGSLAIKVRLPRRSGARAELEASAG